MSSQVSEIARCLVATLEWETKTMNRTWRSLLAVFALVTLAAHVFAALRAAVTARRNDQPWVLSSLKSLVFGPFSKKFR